jgi:hypothetical protein
MRITIEDQVFLEAKQLAAESHKTLSNIVEDVLRSKFAEKKAKNKNIISLVSSGEGGLLHGVDIDNNAFLNDLMGWFCVFNGCKCVYLCL